MLKGRILVPILCALCMTAGAQDLTSFEDIRKMTDEGVTSIGKDLFIEGVCTINGNWGNVAQTGTRYHSKVDKSPNYKTAYFQNADASYGFRITGKHSALYKKLKMGDRLIFNLKGAAIFKMENGMYCIDGVEEENVVKATPGNPATLFGKSKYISELTDADLCTFVTLKDCEFLFKDGSYINIYETYAQNAGMNTSANPNESMDGWASLLCDSRGDRIYTVCNTGTSWRRSSGNPVPSGRGKVSGTILNDSFPRYSAFPLGYQIRCMNESFFKFVEPASYTSIAEWNWNDGKAEFNTNSGARRTLGSAAILSDAGKGELTCDVNASVIRENDFNNPRVDKADGINSRGEKGMVRYGAMRITTAACNWWNWEKNEGNGIRVSFSTEGISGKKLIFGFTFAGGNIKPEDAAFFPVYWKLQYSVDGGGFKDVSSEEYCCRCLPWYWGRPIKGSNYYLSYECGLGMTDHMAVLPDECFGHSNVVLRLVPSRRNASNYSVTSSDKAAITKGLKKNSVVNFGSIVVRYN